MMTPESTSTRSSVLEAEKSVTHSVPVSERIMGMFRTYGQLPQLSGRSYLPLTLLARLPLAMQTIGTMSLIAAVSGSYAIGGAAAGAVGIGAAIGAPLSGWLADRIGQKPVLYVTAVINVLALVALVSLGFLWGALGTTAGAISIGVAFVAGASSPQVGPLSRTRWVALISRDRKASSGLGDTAMSFEGTADEITFVLGPALVGVMAAFISPWLPLAIAAAMTLVLVPLFARHHTVEVVDAARKAPPAEGETTAHETRVSPLALLGIILAVLAMVCMGTFFGGTQGALTAFSGEKADKELAGLLYSAMGLISAAAALSLAAWPAAFTHRMRWIVCAAVLAGAHLFYLLPLSVGTMIPVLMVLGIAVGPTMVTVFAIGAQIAPKKRMGTVMTALSSGIVAGTAIGYSVSGALAENSGYVVAYWVPAIAAMTLLVLGVLMSLLPKPANTAATAAAH